MTILIVIQIIKYRISSYYKRKEKINDFSKRIIEQLKQKKNEENGAHYLSAVQLRDLILDEHMPIKEKNKLWNEVTKKLERNTNVKVSLQEVHGDIMKCLEWIGPCDSEGAINVSEENKNMELSR